MCVFAPIVLMGRLKKVKMWNRLDVRLCFFTGNIHLSVPRTKWLMWASYQLTSNEILFVCVVVETFTDGCQGLNYTGNTAVLSFWNRASAAVSAQQINGFASKYTTSQTFGHTFSFNVFFSIFMTFYIVDSHWSRQHYEWTHMELGRKQKSVK